MEANSMAAMREALLALSAWVKIVKDHPKDKTATECAEFVEQAVNAALPRRQCDVGTAEEQYDRHDKYCNSQPTCRKCLREDAASMCISCFAKWAQMPYEAEEGGAE